MGRRSKAQIELDSTITTNPKEQTEIEVLKGRIDTLERNILEASNDTNMSNNPVWNKTTGKATTVAPASNLEQFSKALFHLISVQEELISLYQYINGSDEVHQVYTNNQFTPENIRELLTTVPEALTAFSENQIDMIISIRRSLM